MFSSRSAHLRRTLTRVGHGLPDHSAKASCAARVARATAAGEARDETADRTGAIDGRRDAISLAVFVGSSGDDVGQAPAEHPRLEAWNLGVPMIVDRSQIDTEVRVSDAGKAIRHDVVA